MSVKITTEAIIALISKHYGIVPDELGEAASSQFDLGTGSGLLAGERSAGDTVNCWHKSWFISEINS